MLTTALATPQRHHLDQLSSYFLRRFSFSLSISKHEECIFVVANNEGFTPYPLFGGSEFRFHYFAFFQFLSLSRGLDLESHHAVLKMGRHGKRAAVLGTHWCPQCLPLTDSLQGLLQGLLLVTHTVLSSYVSFLIPALSDKHRRTEREWRTSPPCQALRSLL